MNTDQMFKEEITLIFNSKDIEDRLVFAELKRINELGYKLKSIDVSEQNLTVELAERITYELGGENPQSVLNDEFLDSYLVSHVNNFNEFNTIGQLLEDSTSLRTPLVIKDGIVDYLDTTHDYIYDELKSDYDMLHQRQEQQLQEHAEAAFSFTPKKMALYFSIILLIITVLFQMMEMEKPGVEKDTLNQRQISSSAAFSFSNI